MHHTAKDAGKNPLTGSSSHGAPELRAGAPCGLPDATAPFEFELVEDRNHIFALQDEWYALFERVGANACGFDNPGWTLQWLTFRTDIKPVAVTLRQNGLLRGIAILHRCNALFGSVKMLEPAACRILENARLMLTDVNETDAFCTLINWLSSKGVADALVVNNVPGSQLSSYPPHAGWLIQPAIAERSLVFDADRDTATKRNPRKIRSRTAKEARRHRRKLDELGEIDFYTLTPDDPRFSDHMAMMIDWKKQRLHQDGAFSRFHRDDVNCDFLCNGFAGYSPARQPWLMFCLTLNGDLISGGAMLPHGKTLQYYFSAFDLAHSDHSPGTVLLSEIFDYMEAHGYRKLDWLGHPQAYKSRFSNTEIPLHQILLPLSETGRQAMPLLKWNMKDRLKNLFYAVPKSVRRHILNMTG